MEVNVQLLNSSLLIYKKSMEEEKTGTKKTSKGINKKFFAGLLTAVAAAGIGGYNYFNEEPPPPTPKKVVTDTKSSDEIGYIDLERLRDRLPNLENLAEIRSREERLRLDLKYAMQPVIITPPKVEDKPFNDSVWQKNAQTIISSAAEISKRKKQVAEEYKKSTEAEYLKKRDEANDKFLNEILNIKLKLQNADNMRLTSEQIEAFNKRLDEIQFERNELQKELMEQWIQEINTAAEEAIKDDVQQLKAQAEAAKLTVERDAAKAKSDAEARNKAIMENAMQESAARQEKRQQLMLELQEVSKQRSELENKIFDNVGDLTAKLAVIHKIKLILAKREIESDDKILPFSVEFDNFSFILPESMKKNSGGAVLFPTSKSIDLTDELIKELDSQAMFEK